MMTVMTRSIKDDIADVSLQIVLTIDLCIIGATSRSAFTQARSTFDVESLFSGRFINHHHHCSHHNHHCSL